MATLSIKSHIEHGELPAIRKLSLRDPFLWLGRGWHDFRRSWTVSLSYGVIFALLGEFLVRYAWSKPYLALPLTCGFLLIAPFLATVFYDISRRLKHGREVRSLLEPIRGLRRNRNLGSIAVFTLVLLFVLIGWTWLSNVVVALFLKHRIVTEQPFTLGLLFLPQHLDFMVPFFLFGGVVAALVFALSVVSLPMMVARKADVVTATLTSLRAVWENPLTMALWALVIAVLTFVGQLLWFVPLAVIFPVLGHASWHAYGDVVELRR